jgi:hypothetical protein
MDDAPAIAWQNKDIDPARPFLAADHVPGSRTDPTLDGTAETVTGQFMVYVVINGGTFTKPANLLADKVMQRFKYRTLISLAEGGILIVKPPEALPGYRDGPDWRVPVRIDYEIQT